MRLRPAVTGDLALLRAWDMKPHVAAARGDDSGIDWAFELARTLPWREMLIAETDGRPVGYVEIIDPAEEEEHYWGDAAPHHRALDIWIGEESDLNRGFGTAMMRLSLERCFAAPEVRAVLIDPLASNPRAHRFYDRLGFQVVGPRRFGPDDCLVMRLDRTDWRPAAP